MIFDRTSWVKPEVEDGPTQSKSNIENRTVGLLAKNLQEICCHEIHDLFLFQSSI